MTRTRLPLSLKNSPLVLVLCQVRIAAVRDMGSYIPKIQDRLRREGFPIDVSGEVREVNLQDGGPVREVKRPHWEFRTLEEDWSIIIGDSVVVLQTTAYTEFEYFLQKLSVAMRAVDEVVGDIVLVKNWSSLC